MNIIEQIYHVGDKKTIKGLECNPYLLIDGDEAILFDPGSVFDFNNVLENITAMIDISKIKYIVLHHQDPDFCSSVTMFEEIGLQAKIITSWKTMTLTQYYGIKSEYYLLEEHGHELVLESGRILQFIPTPYLHFAGAFTTYDTKTKALFSSDLFGAYTFNGTIYADDNYLEKMLAFHEHYMPSNAIIRPVMDVLSTYDISYILPQHGSIINKNISVYIEALRNLECGTLMMPIKKDLMASGGYLLIFNDVIKRLLAIFSEDIVMDIFRSIEELTIDDNNKITEYIGNPIAVWNRIFDEIRIQKGMIWITALEPFVRNIITIYEIQMPKAFDELVKSVDLENQRLLKMNQTLEKTINLVNERLIKDNITGLYNEVFLKALLLEEFQKENIKDVGMLAYLSIDDFSNYKLAFGGEEVNEALNNLAYLLKERLGGNVVFKLDSAEFGVYLKGYTRESVISRLEELRMMISKSELFLNRLTVSIGIAFPDEIKIDLASDDVAIAYYMEVASKRLRGAKHRGKDQICIEIEEEITLKSRHSVLLVDSDKTNVDVLKTFIERAGVEVFVAEDGFQALKIVEEKTPSIIIAEINIPKMDGFLLKEKLLLNSKTKNIEVVFLSYQKDEDSVNRALELGIVHYIKKPYLIVEIMGIINRKIRGKSKWT